MNTIKRLVKARALRQGLLGGHPFWRVVWIGQFIYKRFAKVSKGGEPPITFDEPLKEGEVWAVVHEPEKTKKGLGQGRKFLIGPKRKKPRANTLTGLALAVAGEKILEAPSPERINQILGEKVFEPTPLTKAQKRAAKKQAKLEAAEAKDTAKHLAKAEKAQRARDAADEKAAAKAAAVAVKAAKVKASKDASAAKKAERAAAKAAKAAHRREKQADNARKAAKAARRSEKKAARAAKASKAETSAVVVVEELETD